VRPAEAGEAAKAAGVGGVRGWLRERPWIWVVVLFVAVVLANVVMTIIAVRNQPTVIG
jgi:hypothetical protein